MTSDHAIVYVVDDEPPVLTAITRILMAAGMQAAPFESSREFLRVHDAGAHGCVILDLAMPGLDGMQLQHTLAEAGGDRPIIFLTGRADVPTSVDAMKRGAVDFLTKPVDAERLLAAVRRALEKDRAQRRERAELEDIRARIALLTPREQEVMTRVVAGRLNKQAAAELGASEKTIKVHRARIMQKMRADSLADLVRLAARVQAPAE
jgi:FixJ family two-component response regulator